ncbi:MAG: acyl-ACP--UDP-N-acetylglucosamine O-acyltransferase [Bacteroidales bacterium]|nr:acyl-ACP--UDP-N-acetylglucosamine O-acyltransferase [Bacteroidales bacterium]
MISKQSFVDSSAILGNDVKIDAFAYIYGNTEIGDGTWIGPGAVIMEGARIGRNCKIFPGAVISAVPQDLKFKGEETLAIIGDNTTIRECVTVNRGTASHGKTVIGNNCLLMSYVHVAHDCEIGNNCILVGYTGLAGEVHVDDWAILGGGTVVHQFVHIGGHVIIGGGSKVRMDVPPYIMADRDPLSYMGLNTVGLTRRGFTKEQTEEIENIYRALYKNGMNTSQAVAFIEKEFKPSPEKEYIVNFVKSSTRGIIRSR